MKGGKKTPKEFFINCMRINVNALAYLVSLAPLGSGSLCFALHVLISHTYQERPTSSVELHVV